MGLEAPAPGAGRRWPGHLYRSWLARSITNRVTVTALGLAMVVALALGAMSYLAIRHLVTERIDSQLAHHASLVERELTSTLNAIAQDATDLAANSFVANGLVDSAGRDTYLLPFLREHRLPVVGRSELVLCDFEGRPIASNLTGPSSREPLDEGSAPSPRAGLESRPDGTVLVFMAIPVVFPPTQHQEGVILVRFDLGVVFSAATRGIDPGTEASLLSGGAKLLHASRPDSEPGAIRVARPVTLAPPLDALTLELVLAQDASVFAPFRWVGWGYLLVGFTTLILVAAAARRRAMALTARITRLSDAAKELPSGAPL